MRCTYLEEPWDLLVLTLVELLHKTEPRTLRSDRLAERLQLGLKLKGRRTAMSLLVLEACFLSVGGTALRRVLAASSMVTSFISSSRSARQAALSCCGGTAHQCVLPHLQLGRSCTSQSQGRRSSGPARVR